MNKKSKSGSVAMTLGLCFIIFAFGLAAYNIWSEQNAGRESEEIVMALTDGTAEDTDDEVEYYLPNEQYAETAYEEDAPLYMLYPEMEMPSRTIDGRNYIGVLYIDELGLELPVLSELTYPGLRKSPCRYKGSAYEGNLIIAAHNYKTHFGNIKNLSPGSVIRLIDIDNNEFTYVVQTIETLPGTAVEEMESGGWDLSLFTCNYGGTARITIRCDLEMN